MNGSERLVLPATARSGAEAEFEVRRVSPLRALLGLRTSALALAPLFHDDEVLCFRTGANQWFLGRSPSWTRHVIGSRAMRADIDILPLGLGSDPRYHAMGGLPGAPPDRHAAGRRLLSRAAPLTGAGPSALEAAIGAGLRLAVDPADRTLDVRLFSRACFLHLSAQTVAGLSLDEVTLRAVLGWFDRWSAAISNPLLAVGGAGVPGLPATRVRQVLGEWYGFVAGAISGEHGTPGGYAAALGRQVEAGELTEQEAVGFLATTLFAGTDPPAHTLMWAHSFWSAHGGDPADGLGIAEATATVWEGFRVQPAVNLLVRRLVTPVDGVTVGDVFLVLPPLTHARSNQRLGRPTAFTPPGAGEPQLNPDAYPGLGSGVHHCIGTQLGIEGAAEALRFLLSATRVVRQPDLRPTGLITNEPRRLPAVVMA